MPDRDWRRRNWRRNPRVGDVLDRPWYKYLVRYRINDVTGKGKKICGPGYIGLENADDPDCDRIHMCGTQWLKWSASARLVQAAPYEIPKEKAG